MSDKAKLPALPRVNPADPALARWVAAVTERLEVREGSRGDAAERVLTVRDLAGVDIAKLGRVLSARPTFGPGGLEIDLGGGVTASVSAQQFAAAIQQSSLFKALSQQIDDPTRFNNLAQEVRAALARSVLDEATQRGADIRRVETVVQDQARSLAMVSETLTAAVETAQAGVREVQVASVTADEARAEQITQLEARLTVDVASTDLLPTLPASPYATLAALVSAVPAGDPRKFYRVTNPDADADPLTNDAELLYRWNGSTYVNAGTGNSAKIEERMSAVASRADGLEAQYTLKLNAGGAVAGIGLAATSSAAGVGSSALILQADKIAFVGASETVGTGPGEIDPASPGAARIPFGVDTVTGTVYINGSLKVGGATGPTLDEITSEAGIYLSYSSQIFKYDAAGSPVNTTVTLTANVTGSLTGTLEWSALSGYSGSMPADVTVTAAGAVGTATINVADLTGDTAAFSITLTDGGTTYTDFVTLVKLRDGTDAYTARLTNDSAGVATTNAGVPLTGGFAAATGTMEVYRGANKLASGVTYSVKSGGNPQGLTCSINSSTGVFSVTAKGSWSDASNVATISFQAAVTGGPTLTKDFTLTKNRQAIYTDYIFQRAATQPATPTGTAPAGWSDAPPAGSNPLWMSQVTRNVADDSLVGAWSAAVKLDGDTGTAGAYTEVQYAKNTSSTTAPTTGFTVAPPTLSAGEFLWMQTRTVTPPAAAPAWGTAVRISGEKGDTGSTGAPGAPGDAVDIVFQRSALQPATPAASAAVPSGWYSDVASVPAGANPIWSSVGTKAGGASTYTWQVPVKLEGSPGASGLSIVELTVFRRATASATPSGGTYNFASKTLTPPSGWSTSVPTGTDPVHTSRATVSSADPSATSVAVSGWTASVVSFQNGAPGANGTNGTNGADGANAKTAILTADSLVFKANSSNAVQTPDAIRLDVLKQNTTANVTWATSPTVTLYTAASGGSVVTQNTAVATSTAYLRKADFGANTKVTVTTVCDGITDAVTLVRTVDGVDAPVVAVSNPSHALPSDSAGTVAVASPYAGSGTTLQVFVSGVACTITGVSRTGTGITPGEASGTGTAMATIAAHSAATADTARVEYAITYTRPDGTSATAYAAQAIYKQKAGATGGAGSTGVRGNIVTKITGAWSATTAAAQIASIASAAGAVPTTPIKGDIVSYTGGANECSVAGNPGTWVDVTAYIDGSLVVTGTIAGAQLAADAINGKTISVENTGHIRGGQTDYNTGKGFFLGYSGGQHKVSFGKPALATSGAAASTDAITLANHGYVVGDYTIFSSNGGATGITANEPYVVWGVPNSSTFYVGSYNTDFYSGGTGGIVATNITVNGTPVIAPTGLLWDGNSLLFNGEFRLGQGLLTTGPGSSARWVLDRGELRGMTANNKQLMTLGMTTDAPYLRMRSDNTSGIPLQVMRSVGGAVPVAWVKGTQAGVPVMSVVNDSGTALELTGNSATEATLEVTNSNASGVAVEATGRVEVSKTIRSTGLSAPTAGTGVELAYDTTGDVGYVVSYNRVGTGGSAKPLHLVGSRVVLGGAAGVTVPATPTSTGVAGQIAWDANYAYFCTATNTWRRVALSAW